MKEEQFTVATPQGFTSVINAIISKAELITDQAAVVTLTGDLGSGKTTFTQQLAKSLQVTEQVVSPTFGIMKSYEINGHLYFDTLVHIDAYRIEDISEVGPLRFKELFQVPRTLICIEWPERIVDILPTQKVAVTISIANGEDRDVQVVY
jgi:tRNA threonylcarbamoyladenosine biosynthesis protein TsaE